MVVAAGSEAPATAVFAGLCSTMVRAMAEKAEDVGAGGRRFVDITVTKSPRFAPAAGTWMEYDMVPFAEAVTVARPRNVRPP